MFPKLWLELSNFRITPCVAIFVISIIFIAF